MIKIDAGRPLCLSFYPHEPKAKVNGEAFVSPDTVVLEYMESTPSQWRKTEALADVAIELGTYLDRIETTSKRAVELGRAFSNAMKEFGAAVEGDGRSSSSSESTPRCLFSNTLHNVADVSVATRNFAHVIDDVVIHLQPFLNHIEENVQQTTKESKRNFLIFLIFF